jgi:hypothetical protein
MTKVYENLSFNFIVAHGGQIIYQICTNGTKVEFLLEIGTITSYMVGILPLLIKNLDMMATNQIMTNWKTHKHHEESNFEAKCIVNVHYNLLYFVKKIIESDNS